MSIATEITRITGNIHSAYTAVSGKGGTLPAAQNSANLPAAIQSIPSRKQEQSKTLTLGAATPSTVTPDSGKVLSSVPVVLDTSVIKAENIAKGVTILGITGTHEGGGGGKETWVINEVLGWSGSFSFDVTFTSNGESFSQMQFTRPHYDGIYYIYPDVRNVWVYDSTEAVWNQGEAYRTITLDEPATGDFLTWLQANAVKQ